MTAVTAIAIVLFTPLVGALLAWILGGRLPARWLALLSHLPTVATAGILFSDVAAGNSVSTGLPGAFAAQYGLVRVDGLSATMVLLTAILGLVATLASWRVSERPGSHHALLLFLQAATALVFVADNVALFYVAWEAVLIPMYFLIGGWGHERRAYAASKFFIYTFAGSAFMLLGLILGVLRTGSLEITAFTQAVPASPVGALVFWLLAIGFLVKVPVVPFHTWLPDAHVEAPTAGSIMLAGVLLKMGTYGLIRFIVPFAETVRFGFDVLAVLGVVGVVYGAAMAFVQTDLKRLVAYSSVAHMGFAVLGIATSTVAGLTAAIAVMVSHGFIAGLSFALVGMVYERTHTRDLDRMGGLGVSMRGWSAAFVFAALASAGLPGLAGFPGEFGSLIEGYSVYGPWVALAGVGVLLAGAYNLRAIRGSVQGPSVRDVDHPTLDVHERLIIVVLGVLIITMGVRPDLFVAPAVLSLSSLLEIVGG